MEGIDTIPNTDADNALILGTALHTGIEEGVEQALDFYENSFPVLTDDHIHEMMKLEAMIPKAKAMLPPGGTFELPIGNSDFIGFMDYLVPVGKGLKLDGLITGEDLNEFEAYDQLRYLKNKDTITEEGLKASDLLKRIATDFRLNLGTAEDTGYTLETIVEENQTLFDMIQSALDETLMNTKQLYVLYDDAGKLTLKNINTMKLNLLIDEETGENFSYESSIDEQTYNKIKLAYNNEKTGKRELFIAQDGAKMNQWGVLQYFEEVQTKTGASAKADALLKLYDQKTRKLTIQNAFGDVRVRAGSAVVVALNLGDIVTNNYMVVNKVTHTFRGDEHMMELDLIGGEFIA